VRLAPPDGRWFPYAAAALPVCPDGADHGEFLAIDRTNIFAMSQAITLDAAGRIVLPAEVRRRLNLGPGSRLSLEVVAERIELTPQPDAGGELALSAGKRSVLRPSGKAFDAAAATRSERDAQARRGARR
jgi:AbrB family looped-hinge helix DNA binding protein